MADGVLRFGCHLCEGQAVGFCGSKDGVVAKAAFSSPPGQYLALHDAFEEVLLLSLDQGDDGAEACRAAVGVLQFVQQAPDVGIRRSRSWRRSVP